MGELKRKKEKEKAKMIKRRKGEGKGKRREGRTRKRREAQRKKERGEKGIKVSREQGAEGLEVDRKGVARNDKEKKVVRKKRWEKVEKRREATEKAGEGKRKKEAEKVWEEEMVRVGTGYRVRWAEGTGEKKRVFDLGYSDRKEYVREEGVEVEIAKNNIGRTVKYVGEEARQRAMNVVCKREKMRKRSVYTGCGRTRKSRVGKKKLKPTKVRAR